MNLLIVFEDYGRIDQQSFSLQEIDYDIEVFGAGYDNVEHIIWRADFAEEYPYSEVEKTVAKYQEKGWHIQKVPLYA